MASKLQSKGAAIALSAAALSVLALLPSASAAGSTASGIFGVQSVNTADSSIRGFAGAIKPSDSGGGSSDPGETETPSTCGPLVADPSGYKSYQSYNDDYSVFYIPQSSGKDSDWIDEVKATGSTISVGTPSVKSTNIAARYADNSTATLSVDLPQLDEDALPSPTQATKNTGVNYDKSPIAHAGFRKAGSSSFDANVANSKLNSPELLSYLSSKAGKTVTSAYAYSYEVSYPLTVTWKATGEQPSCSTTSTPLSYTVTPAE